MRSERTSSFEFSGISSKNSLYFRGFKILNLRSPFAHPFSMLKDILLVSLFIFTLNITPHI